MAEGSLPWETGKGIVAGWETGWEPGWETGSP